MVYAIVMGQIKTFKTHRAEILICRSLENSFPTRYSSSRW